MTNYLVPEDWHISVVDDPSQREFVVRETYSDKIYVFHDFHTAKESHLQGRLAEITTRQWWDASPRKAGWKLTYNTGGDLIQIIPPAPQDGIRIVYKYDGSFDHKVSSVEVWDGQVGSGTLLMRAVYTYWDDVDDAHPTEDLTDLGHTGCLVQVKVSRRASNDTGTNLSIERYTQYRYYLNNFDLGEAGRADYGAGALKAVFDHDAVQQMVADSSANEPSDLLLLTDDEEIPILDYAGKLIEYYAEQDPTNASETPWYPSGENLNTKYGGADYDELHELRVKAEHIGGKAGCTSCSGGSSARITRQYHYLHVWPTGTQESPIFQWWIWHNATAPRDVNETRMLVVEDTLVHDDPTNYPDGRPVYRKIYALNDFSRKLREVFIEDPTKGDSPQTPLRAWCWAWTYMKADTDGDGQFNAQSDYPHLKHRVAEYRLPSAYNVTLEDDLRKFLKPYYRERSNNTETWANDEAVLRTSDGLIYVYAYENSQGLRTEEKAKKGRTGTAHYVSAMDWGNGSTNKPKDRIVARYIYPAQNMTRAAGTQTKYDYTFWDGNFRQLKSCTTKIPAVVTSQNGPASGSADPGNATVTAREDYYDKAGRLRWRKDGEGYVSYYSYHPQTGALALVVVDVPNAYSPPVDNSKWVAITDGSADTIQPSRGSGLPASTLAIISKYEFDAQGREVLQSIHLRKPTPMGLSTLQLTNGITPTRLRERSGFDIGTRRTTGRNCRSRLLRLISMAG